MVNFLKGNNPSKRKHCLIFDPIAFAGGSKIATNCALSQCDNSTRFTVVTASPNCWKSGLLNDHQLSIVYLPCPAKLALATQGIGYWLKQLYFCLYLASVMLFRPKVSLTVGASGPGVDMALYLCRLLFRFPIMQLVHGPVGCSRSIGYCLAKANFLFYLSSSRHSLVKTLSHYFASQTQSESSHTMAQLYLASRHCMVFDNGLVKSQWPSGCQTKTPVLFWSASLLKWKGLDTFVASLKLLPNGSLNQCNICFIRPKNIKLEVSVAPVSIKGVQWYQQPNDLDAIRASSNIYVSTSTNEPFGLAILEALAAGMCVIIPNDDAYWDQVLTHDFNCLKYQADDVESLRAAIITASTNMDLVRRLGRKAKLISASYKAERCYQQIAHCVDSGAQPTDIFSRDRRVKFLSQEHVFKQEKVNSESVETQASRPSL